MRRAVPVVAAAIAALTIAHTVARAWALNDDPAPPLAIVDATIVVKAGTRIEHATIVFRDGLVAAVGTQVQVPPDAFVEDGKGLTVYPGFIDAGVAFPLEAVPAEAAPAKEGVTPDLHENPPVETPEARRKGVQPALDVANRVLLDPAKRTKERQAGFAVALALPPQGFLAGQSALVGLGEKPRRDSVIAARLFLHAGLDGPDNVPGYPTTPMGAFAHIRQVAADARRQEELEKRAERGANEALPAFDPDLDAVLPALDGKQRVAWTADAREQVERSIALGRELGLSLVLFDARHAAKAAPILRRNGIPAIVSLNWGVDPKAPLRELDPAPTPKTGHTGKPLVGPLSSPAEKIGPEAPAPAIDGSQETSASFADRKRKHDEDVSNLHDLLIHGVPVAITSYGMDPDKVREHLRDAIKAGLSEEDALAALTWSGAFVLGVRDRLGTLEPGKLAYATVLTGSLGDDKAKVRFTVVAGARLDGEAIEPDQKLLRLSGKFDLVAGNLRGVLALSVVAGNLVGSFAPTVRTAAELGAVTLVDERLAFTIPSAAAGAKADVTVAADWVSPERLVGTATIDGKAVFLHATRRPEGE